MKWIRALHHLRTYSIIVDDRTLIFSKNHADLLMAIVTVGIAVWGLISGHANFVLIMAIVGAFGYFVGLVAALSVGVISLIVGMSLGDLTHIAISDIFVQLAGYISIARLGHRHKTLKEARHLAAIRPHEEVPWVMVNEIRTSLAAIRFLLFPLHGEEDSVELQQATKELSRLENLFHDLEQKRRMEESTRR